MYWSDVLQQHIKLKITLFGKHSLDGDVIWVDVLVSILVSSFPSVRLLNILNLVGVGLSVGYEIWNWPNSQIPECTCSICEIGLLAGGTTCVISWSKMDWGSLNLQCILGKLQCIMGSQTFRYIHTMSLSESVSVSTSVSVSVTLFTLNQNSCQFSSLSHGHNYLIRHQCVILYSKLYKIWMETEVH